MSIDWEKVISNPLGLAGFALFLIFLFIRKSKNGEQYGKYFLGAAIVVLVAGLAMSIYSALGVSSPPASAPAQTAPPTAASPAASPAAGGATGQAAKDCSTEQNVEGDGNVSIGCLEGSNIQISTGK